MVSDSGTTISPELGVWIVVVDHNQGGFATASAGKLMRDFTIVDAIDIVIVGKSTLAYHHECQGQKRKDKSPFDTCNVK